MPRHRKPMTTESPDYPACVFGVRAEEPGFGRFVFAPRPQALEWAHAVVPTPHGEIVASWGVRGAVFHASLTVPEGTAALMLIPIRSLGHEQISVNDQPAWPDGQAQAIAGVSCAKEDTGCVAFDLRGGQTYHFRSR